MNGKQRCISYPHNLKFILEVTGSRRKLLEDPLRMKFEVLTAVVCYFNGWLPRFGGTYRPHLLP
jgi:hypothetical protein